MPMKYVAFAVFIWVIASLMGAALDSSTLTEKPSDLDWVTSGPFLTMPASGGEDISIPIPNPNFFPALWRIMTFNFGFLTAEWAIVKWIVFLPLTAMFVYALAMMFINLLRGTI